MATSTFAMIDLDGVWVDRDQAAWRSEHLRAWVFFQAHYVDALQDDAFIVELHCHY